MNNTLYPIITAVCLCWSSYALAQKDKGTTNYSYPTINTLAAYDSLDYDYQIIHFREIPSIEDRIKLRNSGIHLLEYIEDKKYVSFFSKSLINMDLENNQVLRIEAIPLQAKLSPNLNSGNIPFWAISKNSINVILKFYKNVDHAVILKLCERDGIHLNASNKVNNYLNVSIEKDRLFEVAALPYISFIEAIPEPGRTEDINGSTIHRSNVIDVPYPSGRKYDGNGIGLLCRDDGSVGPHIDFHNRLNNSFVENPNTGGGLHGDGVAGIMAGAGNLNPRKKGMAKGADLYVMNYQADFLDETIDLHINNNVLITNSSYSNGCNGGYTNIAATVDQQLFDYPNLMHVFSAGNSNGQNCGYGAGNQWGNITGGHKQAKNCITTANIYSDGTLHENSSRGPAYDGRIKPDISANGAGQTSTSPNNDYQDFGGTSAASPGIAGVLAQLHQAYRTLNNEETAPAALLKACLLNSANDLGNRGPDFKFGWGHVNALKALKILENNYFLTGSISHQQTNTHSLFIPPNTKKVDVMLYWPDQEASPFSSKALVNDLDLTMKNSNGILHFPWVLNSHPDSAILDSPATYGEDHLNNMEQVTLVDPAAGSYSIDVKGFEIPFGEHDYFVVWEILTDEIELTYPVGGESFEPGETVRVHWDTAVDPTSFSLSYSMDDGQSFQEIETVEGTKRMYDWQLPNEVTGSLYIKIENSEANIFDQNNTSISIAPTPNNIEIIQACHNFIKLKWSPVDLGSDIDSLQYQVFLLGEKYMEPIGLTATNSFDVPTIFNDPTKDHWIAVSTLAAGGLKSERSVAVHYNDGLLNCQGTDDIELLSIDTPNEGFLFGCGSYDIPVEVTIRNNGLFPQNEFSIAYTINNGQSIVEEFSQMLLPGQIASFQFEQPLDLLGDSDISLKVFSQLLSDEVHFNDSVEVFFSTALYPGDGALLPFKEDFETGVFPPPYFAIVNSDKDKTWEEVETIGSDGQITNCVFVDNYYYSSAGETDEMLVVPIDLFGISKPKLNFDVAYAQYSDVYSDGLLVEISDDCGGTFNTVIYEKHGADLATIEDQNSPFHPTESGHWRTEEIDLEDYVGSTIVLKFKNIAGYGNSLFIDNINVEETISLTASFSINQNIICKNSPVIFQNNSIGNIQSYQWDFGEFAIPSSSTSFNPMPIIFNKEGPHEVTLTIFGDGFSTTIKKVVHVLSLPEAIFDFSIDGNTGTFLNHSKNESNVTWDFGDGHSSSLNNPVHNYTNQGVYQTILFAENECGVDSLVSIPFQIILSDSADIYNFPKTTLSPNPVSNRLNLVLENYKQRNLEVTIFDVRGIQMMYNSFFINESKSKVTVDCSNLKPGIYFVEIKNEQYYDVQKLVVERLK